jgi:hypothetical protein
MEATKVTTSEIDRARLLLAETFPSATTQLIPVSGRTTGGYFLKVEWIGRRAIFEQFKDVITWVSDQLLRCDLSQGLGV